MFGGIDPKKMQAMMKQMGIKQEEIAASRVIIEGPERRIVIEEPNVVRITMQGQDSWQISGTAHEEAAEGISADDIRLIMDKTGASESDARAALEKADGDLAVALTSFE